MPQRKSERYRRCPACGRDARSPNRVRKGYSLTELARRFGESRAKVWGWIQAGWFGNVRDRGSATRFPESSVLHFLERYQFTYNLAKVDQAWLLWLLFFRRGWRIWVPRGGSGEARRHVSTGAARRPGPSGIAADEDDGRHRRKGGGGGSLRREGRAE
jgi:hypothetical protein